MKKIFLSLTIMLLTVFAFALCASANEYGLPQIAVPPTVDGVRGADEYLGTYHYHISNSENYVHSTMQTALDTAASFDVDITWFYDGSVENSGLYFCFVSTDSSIVNGNTLTELSQTGLSKWSLITDKVYIAIDPYYQHTDSNLGTLAFSIFPWSLSDVTGPAIVYEQNYLKVPSDDQVRLACNADITFDGDPEFFDINDCTLNGYTLEFFVSFDALGVDLNKAAPHDIGDQIGLGLAYFDNTTYYATDFGTGDINASADVLYEIAFKSRYYNTVVLEDVAVWPKDYVAADRSAYMDALRAANLLLNNKSEYTDDSVKILTDTLHDTSAYIYNVSQERVDAFTKQLREATGKLVKRGYGETQSLLQKVASLASSDYTADSWNRFVTARDAAKILTNDNAKADIQAAYAELKNAYESLVNKTTGEHNVNTAALEEALTNYDNILRLKDKYTDETWSVYEAAVNEARALTKKDNTQSDYDALAERINLARASLSRRSTLIDSYKQTGEGIDTVLLIYIIIVAAAVVTVVAVVVIKALLKKKKAAAPTEGENE